MASQFAEECVGVWRISVERQRLGLPVHLAVDNLPVRATELLDSTNHAQLLGYSLEVSGYLRKALINALVGANVCGSRLFMLVFCFTIDIAAKMAYTVAE